MQNQSLLQLALEVYQRLDVIVSRPWRNLLVILEPGRLAHRTSDRLLHNIILFSPFYVVLSNSHASLLIHKSG